MARARDTTALTIGTLVLLLGLAPLSARAQPDDGPRIRFSISPYAWLSDLDGTLGSSRAPAEVDLSTADILGALSFGIMGSAEIQRGHWLLAADGIHRSFDRAYTFADRNAAGSLALGQRETIIQPVVGYSLGDRLASLELLAGARIWDLGTTLGVVGPASPPDQHSMSQRWTDATGGFRIRIMPATRAHFAAAADVGGGGSHFTWQWYTSLGYDFWSKVSLGIAYRMLDVTYDRHDFLYDTRSQGIVVDATFRR